MKSLHSWSLFRTLGRFVAPGSMPSGDLETGGHEALGGRQRLAQQPVVPVVQDQVVPAGVLVEDEDVGRLTDLVAQLIEDRAEPAGDETTAPVRVGMVSSIGYFGFLVGPPLIGFLAQNFTVLLSILIVAVALLATIPLARVLQPVHSTEHKTTAM